MGGVRMNKFWKIAGNALWNILLYSLVSIVFKLDLFHGNMVQKIAGWILLFVCLFDVGLNIKKILFSSGTQNLKVEEKKSLKSISKVVEKNNSKVFKKQIRTLLAQIKRMDDREKRLDEVLEDHFGASSLSYNKFSQTIEGVNQAFIENIKAILDRISLFDEEGYKILHQEHKEYTDEIIPYQKQIQDVDAKLEENEKIIEKLNRLGEEVTQLKETYTPIDQLPAMQEVNELIDQTKLYKQ